ncbi:MAG: hypothetical protein R3Y50_09620 [Rikenellaceae bacterium]
MRKLLLLFIAVLGVSNILYAQYYTTGNNSVSTRWNQLKSDDKRIIYPDFFAPKARIVEGYLDTMRNYIATGLNPKIDYLPIILYPDKAKSNGLVTWTPKRMELYTTPSTDGYSLPWLKQLTVHEYRHVVQLSNLNRGFVRGLGYVIGEHAVGLAAALVPTWFYEGDAVVAETQFAQWGRGKQPLFSSPVRAMVAEADGLWNYDFWRAGSYRYNFPSIYELGYFSVWAGQTFYSPQIWDTMLSYCAKNPIIAIFKNRALAKEYNANSEIIINKTLEELKPFWEESFEVESSTKPIVASKNYYQKYSNPIPYADSLIFSQYYSKATTYSFVMTNVNSGKSSIVQNSAYINSRSIIDGDRVYWSEYKPSLFWDNNSSSVVKSATLVKNRRGKYRLKERNEPKTELDNCYFITKVDNDRFGLINFDKLDNPHLIITDSDFKPLSNTPLDGWDCSVQGMAYDSVTDKLYLSIVNNDGVSLVSYNIENDSFGQVKKPSHVAITNLTADSGKLYFTSTASGKEEAHIYDLESDKEYQLTSSKIGSNDISKPFKQNGEMVVATADYQFMGRNLAVQKVELSDENMVDVGQFPSSELIPDWYDWDVLKIDTINITPDSKNVESITEKRYRKLAHSFAPHSWLPVMTNPIKIINENEFDLALGATVVSQNLLGGVVSSVGYGYVPATGLGLLSASLELNTLPVHFSLNFDYGGNYQYIYVAGDYDDESYPTFPVKRHYNFDATAKLPINLSDGRRSRVIMPYLAYSYDNSILLESLTTQTDGVDKLSAGLIFQNYKYKSERDIESPLGYTVQLSGAVDPTNFDSFGRLFSIYGRGALPGILENHSVVLEGSFQHQKMGNYNFTQKTIYPRGCVSSFATEDVYGATAKYTMPIAYPDWGIRNFLHIKRIAATVFGEYAYATMPIQNFVFHFMPYTYGGEIKLNYTLFGLGFGIETDISIYKPSEKDRVMVGFGFSFSI